MKNQLSIPLTGASLTNWVGDTISSCLGLGAGSAPTLFVCPAPSCFPPQNLYLPWNTASEIPWDSGSDHLGVSHESVWRSDVLDLLASGWALTFALHDQQCPPQHGAESTKSAKAQPEEINLGEVQIIKSATEQLQFDSLSPEISPDVSCHTFKFSDRLPAQSQWLGTLSAIRNSAGLTVLVVRHSKNSTSNRIPKAIGSTPRVVRSGVSVLPKSTNREPGIGNLVDQPDTRVHAKQSFDFTLIEALPVQFGVIDGLESMAPETNLRQHFTECRGDFESTTPLQTRLTRSDSPLLSPAESRSYDSEPAQSDTRNADGYPTNRSLGWPDHQANHMPFGHPDELPRAKFLADATTISAHPRPKTARLARNPMNQTPTKTTP